ncbi:hypothetical protein GGS24DRAFT_511797 [Hypoxylon argillaceum]|nr:hypothetical protein GGS24DRAFT_511797 [Hypoxylon argillaceum]
MASATIAMFGLLTTTGAVGFGNSQLNTLRTISAFGERPAFAPDAQRVAFISNSFGQAFEIDLRTEELTLLTHYPNTGYLRVQYLPNGDLFLIGARTFEGEAKTRDDLQEMWILPYGGTAAIPLNHSIWEGVAISLQTNKIAWANNAGQYPDQIPENVSIIYTGDIVYNNGAPSLQNKKEVLRAMLPDCAIEPQDFRKNDTELIYSCYRTNATSRVSLVKGVNLETGEITTYRGLMDEYNEVEGIYPGGEYTLVESCHDCPVRDGTNGIDIYRMRLVANSSDFVRLTYFNRNPPNKAGNPVISPDGSLMAVQASRAGDQHSPGIGYGILLLNLNTPDPKTEL